MTTFRLPDLGEGLTEAEIVAWQIGVGDHVVADQPLLSVETAKAVVEVPSPQAGRIARLYAKPGDMVPIGAPLVDFEDGAGADQGTVVGELPTPAATHGPPSASPSHAPAAEPAASPAVRAEARRRGLDLAAISGSGPGGAVTRADLDRASARLGAAGEGRAEPLRGVRRAMALNMQRAHAEVVPATVTDLADIGAWPADADVTVRLVRAVAVGCRAEPALNAWYLGREQGRRLSDRVDLGIATDTEDGLFVPVLRDVGGRDAADLRRDLDAMKAAVKARRVPPEAMRGQTITLSNFGMFGGRHAALVVLPPQVAILGAGRIHDEAVVEGGQVVARRVLPLSLTFDHRAVMGGEASRFLAAVIGDLAKPT